MQDKVRVEQAQLMEECDELVDFYQDELAVSESVAELLDVGQLLEGLSPPGDVDALLQGAAAAADARELRRDTASRRGGLGGARASRVGPELRGAVRHRGGLGRCILAPYGARPHGSVDTPRR